MGKFTDGQAIPASPANGMKGLSVADSLTDIDGDEFIQSQAWSNDLRTGECVPTKGRDEQGEY